mgnify:CR=1 FL=1
MMRILYDLTSNDRASSVSLVLDLDLSMKKKSGNHGWRTGKSTRLSSMWSGFDSDLDAVCGLRLVSPTKKPALTVFPSH